MTVQPLEQFKITPKDSYRVFSEYSKHYLTHGRGTLKDYVVVVAKVQGTAGHCLLGLSMAGRGMPITQETLELQLKLHANESTVCVVHVEVLLEFLAHTSKTEHYTVPPALCAFLDADTTKPRSVCWDGSSWYAGLIEV